MNFEPQKFFVGIIDFFSVLLPGALLAYLWKGSIVSAVLDRPTLALQGTESWMIFLFLSYLLGHIAFLLGSLGLDELYDWVRNGTDTNQIRRLADEEWFSNFLIRKLARILFPTNPDRSVAIAARIKSRSLSPLDAGNAINAFQWSKAVLSKQHSEGLNEVHSFEAHSKFFRSFAVVLVVLGVIYAFQCRMWSAIGCCVLLVPTLWRFADQRFKSTQQAYWFVITLEAMSINPTHDVSSPPRDIDTNSKKTIDGRTHAGGVVYDVRDCSVKYLLVEESKNRKQLVLPKGHIEWDENEKQTAVREVYEETGCWAQIIRWIDDVRFDDDTLVRFYLMRFAEEKKRWPPEERQHRWLTIEECGKENLLQETITLLNKAADIISKSARQ